jgi:hypothetical protein
VLALNFKEHTLLPTCSEHKLQEKDKPMPSGKAKNEDKHPWWWSLPPDGTRTATLAAVLAALGAAINFSHGEFYLAIAAYSGAVIVGILSWWLHGRQKNQHVIEKKEHQELIDSISKSKAGYLIRQRFNGEAFDSICIDNIRPPQESKQSRSGNRTVATMTITFKEPVFVRNKILHIDCDYEHVDIVGKLLSIGALVQSKTTRDGQHYKYSPVITNIQKELSDTETST